MKLYQRGESKKAIYDLSFRYFGGTEEEFTPPEDYDEENLKKGRLPEELIQKTVQRVCNGLEQATGLVYQKFVYNAVIFSTKTSGNIRDLTQVMLDELDKDYQFGGHQVRYDERVQNMSLAEVEERRAQGTSGNMTLGWLYYGRKKAERMRISAYYGETSYTVFIDGCVTNEKIQPFYDKYKFDH